MSRFSFSITLMVVIFAEMIWLSVEQQEYCPSNYERIDEQEDYQNAEATIYASEDGIFRSLWKWGGVPLYSYDS